MSEKKKKISSKKENSNEGQYRLPDDTNRIYDKDQCSNFSLALNKYVAWGKDLKISKDFFINVNTNFPQNINLRHLNMFKAIEKNHLIDDFHARIDWRMTVGLGAENVHETSMTLHHIYGIPYIPGSALKGIARNAAVEELCEETTEELDVMDALLCLPDISNMNGENKKKETVKKAGKVKRQDQSTVNVKVQTIEKILGSWELFDIARNVFGSQTNSGKVIFFDAFPEENANIVSDIMTPHYPDYYSKNEPPGDWQSPNPISFLTVERTSYHFYLAAKKSYKEKDDICLKHAKKWMMSGLQNNGVGAKTAVGYGLFDIGGDKIKVLKGDSPAPTQPSPKKAPEPEIWKKAVLSYAPNTRAITARWEGKNATAKDNSIIPQSRLEQLKKKKKPITATVKAEPIGGKEYRLVEVLSDS